MRDLPTASGMEHGPMTAVTILKSQRALVGGPLFSRPPEVAEAPPAPLHYESST